MSISAALQRLKEGAERAKLSSADVADINFPLICADEDGPKHLIHLMTRDELETLVGDMVSRLEEPSRTALEDAGLSATDIDEVVLVDGMTRMPLVQKGVPLLRSRNRKVRQRYCSRLLFQIGVGGGLLRGVSLMVDIWVNVRHFSVAVITSELVTNRGSRAARETHVERSKSSDHHTALRCCLQSQNSTVDSCANPKKVSASVSLSHSRVIWHEHRG